MIGRPEELLYPQLGRDSVALSQQRGREYPQDGTEKRSGRLTTERPFAREVQTNL